MAFVPEDIEEKLFNRSMSAFKIYFFACKWRHHKSKTFLRTLADCRRQMPKASFYRGLAELEEENLIRVEGDVIVWLAGDFSPVDKKYDAPKPQPVSPENETQNFNSLKNETPRRKSLENETGNSLKNETKQSQKWDSPYIRNSSSLTSNEEEREKSARENFDNSDESENPGDEFDPFPETANLVDAKFRRQLDRTLHWIQTDKQLSRRNFPARHWLQFLEKLSSENIDLEKFKEFYEWCGNQDWVIEAGGTITPELMLSQLEKFKKREILAAKKEAAGSKNATGKTSVRPAGNNGKLTNREVLDESADFYVNYPA